MGVQDLHERRLLWTDSFAVSRDAVHGIDAKTGRMAKKPKGMADLMAGHVALSGRGVHCPGVGGEMLPVANADGDHPMGGWTPRGEGALALDERDPGLRRF